MQDGTLYWITGLAGAGKTTIGNRLYYEIKKSKPNVVLLDGDLMKSVVSDIVGYSDEARRKRAMKYAALCKLLTDQGLVVICCTIAMYDEVRAWNRVQNKGYVEVFLNVPMNVLRERDQKGLYSKIKDGRENNVAGEDLAVEYPKNPDIEIINDGSLSIAQCVRRILDYKVYLSSDYDRDTEYWNDYYKKDKAPIEPSLFAKTILSEMQKGKTVLELGCGNGRDSLYFYRNGLNVTAVDASDCTISQLKQQYDEDNICFICDDFVCSPAIFSGQFDYCYSRFSLHAINEEQEIEVIKNVFNVLKSKGKFFIEVRSVHDELYGKGERVGKDSFVHDGHYRRFVHKELLENELKQCGFIIDYSEEQRGFAPFGESDPPVIRVIAKKN